MEKKQKKDLLIKELIYSISNLKKKIYDLEKPCENFSNGYLFEFFV
jgi:hypothetical protein